MYRNLDASKIEQTIEILQRRIRERFPKAGLGKVCQELLHLIQESKSRCEKIGSPNIMLRIGVGIIILFIITILVGTLSSMTLPEKFKFGEFVQILEAGIQATFLIGGTIIFLITAENRLKRSRTLKALNELRSLSHVIDMHQLPKDPERALNVGTRTSSSPKEDMSAFELSRYLDYCSEMLSLVGKIASLYGQNFSDNVVLRGVNEIEILTTGLSQKIWQKIMILYSLEKSNPIFATEAPFTPEIPKTPTNPIQTELPKSS